LDFHRRARGEYTSFRLDDVNNNTSTCQFIQAKHDITAASAANETFKIAGDHRADFSAGTKFMIDGSAGAVHDGDWVVDSVTLSGSDTLITVTGNVSSDSTSGHILHSEFQLFKTYAEGGSGDTEDWDEDIYDIQPGEITVEVDDVEVDEGTDYTLDDSTGVIVFTAGNTPADTSIIEAIFKFYFRVRFDTPYSETLRDKGEWEVRGLELVEVKP